MLNDSDTNHVDAHYRTLPKVVLPYAHELPSPFFLISSTSSDRALWFANLLQPIASIRLCSQLASRTTVPIATINKNHYASLAEGESGLPISEQFRRQPESPSFLIIDARACSVERFP